MKSNNSQVSIIGLFSVAVLFLLALSTASCVSKRRMMRPQSSDKPVIVSSKVEPVNIIKEQPPVKIAAIDTIVYSKELSEAIVNVEVRERKLVKDNQFILECRVLGVKLTKGSKVNLKFDDVISLQPQYEYVGKVIKGTALNMELKSLREFTRGSYLKLKIFLDNGKWMIKEIIK